jgi:hypothetical protein
MDILRRNAGRKYVKQKMKIKNVSIVLQIHWKSLLLEIWKPMLSLQGKMMLALMY